MSDANRTAIRVSREVAFKTPYASPLMQQLRITSVGLAFAPDTVTSAEIDATRQIVDQPVVGFTSGGDVPMELSIDNTDALLPGLFMNEWVRTPEVLNGVHWKYGFGSSAATRITALTATTLTLAATSVLAGTSTNNTAAVFSVGHLLSLTGFGVTDQLLRVSASSATTVTFAGATAVAIPPSTSRAKVVGFEGVSGDLKATTTGGTALTSSVLNFTTMNLAIGQWIFLSRVGNYSFGFGGFARVSSIAQNRLGLDVVPAGFVDDNGAGKTVRAFYTDSIRNGVQEDMTYYVEEEFGLANLTRYLYHRGQEVNSRVIAADTKAIVTDTWNFMGADALPLSPNRQTGAQTLSIGKGAVLNSSTAIPLFYENGIAVTAPNYVNSFSLSVDNAKRTRDAIGVLGAADIASGRISVTGSLSTYFGDETLYNKVINNTISSLTIGFSDPSIGRAELYDVPKLKYSSGSPDVTGIDTDIFVALAFQGLRDIQNNRDYTILLSRFEQYG